MDIPKQDDMEVSITGAEIIDAETISNIHKVVCLETYPNDTFGITKEDVLERVTRVLSTLKWKEVIAKNDSKTFVACINGVVVGFCFAKKEEKLGRIGSIYILPEFQSKGIGQKLINEALGYLGRVNPVVLEVVTYNDKAITFYKKLGFVESGIELGQEQRVVFASGIVLPEIEMVLPPSYIK